MTTCIFSGLITIHYMEYINYSIYIYILLLLLLSDLGTITWVIVEALLLVETITINLT